MKAVKPALTQWLTPYLTVENAEKSLEFYERAFGFERGDTAPLPDGSVGHASMKYHDMTVVMFSPEGNWSFHRTPAHTGIEFMVSFYVYCDDVDALVERARSAGATVLSEPEDAFWGDRFARIADHDGYIWVFATSKQ